MCFGSLRKIKAAGSRTNQIRWFTCVPRILLQKAKLDTEAARLRRSFGRS